MSQNYPIISLCFKGLVPNGVIKSSGLSFLQDQFRNLLKKSLAGTRRNSRKSFHASFVRTCSSGSERAANDVIHLTDGCDAAGAKRLHLAAITTSRPTPRRIPRTFYFLWHSTTRWRRLPQRAGMQGGGRSVESTSGANECARGRWYFQFHRAWVNEAHEGWREVRATTLRNFPTRRQNWRRRRAPAKALVFGAPL